jgi:hypothetical protein
MSNGIGQFATTAARAGAALAIALAASTVRAEPADDVESPDRPQRDDPGAERAIDRTWLYADDARVARPMVIVGTSNVSYTAVSSSPSLVVRPFAGCPAPCNTYRSFAANTATPGTMLAVGGELGLAPRLSLVALGQVGFGGAEATAGAGAGAVGAIAGLRIDVLPESRHLHLVLSGGYLREAWQGPTFDDDTGTYRGGSPNGDNGGWARAAISGDIDRLRLAGTLHGVHVFTAGRDPLDVMVQAGASYRLAGELRAGIEYVGQDLEESFTPQAEGGARHFIGPIASVQLLRDRLTIVTGPSVGLTAHSPEFLGRLAVSCAF